MSMMTIAEARGRKCRRELGQTCLADQRIARVNGRQPSGYCGLFRGAA